MRGSVETLDAALANLEHRRRVGLSSGKAEVEKRDESEQWQELEWNPPARHRQGLRW